MKSTFKPYAVSSLYTKIAVLLVIGALVLLAFRFLQNPEDHSEPADIETLKSQADYYTQVATQDLPKAESLYKRILADSPMDPWALRGLGICLYRTGKLEQSEEMLVKLARCDSCEEQDVRVAKEYLGRIYSDQGKYDEAEDILKESIKGLDEFNKDHDHYYGCPYQALGELYSNIGRQKEMVLYYMKAADAEPSKPLPQSQAAIKCMQAGDYPNAIKYIDRALALDEHYSYLVTKGYILILNKSYAESEKLFAKAQKLNQTDSGARIGMGHLAIVKKDYARAIELFQGALKESIPSGPVDEIVPMAHLELTRGLALIGMGWAYANQNMHEQAIGYYDQIPKDDPFYYLSALSKGNSLTGLARFEQAEALFEMVLKVQPENQYALAEMALVKYNKGENDDAEKYFRKALEMDPEKYTCPYEGLGLVYLKQGKAAKARENFQKAITINPDIEYKKFNGLAKIYIKEGKIKEAKKLLEKSIANYPYDPEAKELLDKLESTKSM